MANQQFGVAPRVRRASSLFVEFEGDGFLVRNYVQNAGVNCNLETLRMISSARSWTPVQTLQRNFEELSDKALEVLIKNGILLTEGSIQSRRDIEFQGNWEWGVEAAAFHFGMKNAEYAKEGSVRSLLRAKSDIAPPPILHERNNEVAGEVFALPEPNVQDGGAFALLSKRRSVRAFERRPLRVSDLADCLMAGLGITHFVNDSIFGQLPLKMTPSGGARNPFEAYVFARNVEGVAIGAYHYSAAEHTLAKRCDLPYDRPLRLFSVQDWVSECCAIVLLIAHFKRTMWKYQQNSE